MTLVIEPAKLARAQELGGRLRKAIAALDGVEIARILRDPSIERIEFAVGKTYRLATIGAPPVRVDFSIPEPTDTVSTALGKLTGLDAAATAADAGLVELRGTYRGRLPSPGFPHTFRLPNGATAVLADMDIVAWEIVK